MKSLFICEGFKSNLTNIRSFHLGEFSKHIFLDAEDWDSENIHLTVTHTKKRRTAWQWSFLFFKLFAAEI